MALTSTTCCDAGYYWDDSYGPASRQRQPRILFAWEVSAPGKKKKKKTSSISRCLKENRATFLPLHLLHGRGHGPPYVARTPFYTTSPATTSGMASWDMSIMDISLAPGPYNLWEEASTSFVTSPQTA